MPAGNLGRMLASVRETDQQLVWEHRGEERICRFESVGEQRRVPSRSLGNTVRRWAGTGPAWSPREVLKDKQDEVVKDPGGSGASPELMGDDELRAGTEARRGEGNGLLVSL